MTRFFFKKLLIPLAGSSPYATEIQAVSENLSSPIYSSSSYKSNTEMLETAHLLFSQVWVRQNTYNTLPCIRSGFALRGIST